MKIAGYARKSVLTDKGDSIETQKKIISDYVDHLYPGSSITFYEDEGYTGSNINRPGFTQLMQDVRNNNFQMLICYRLDRISRNVSDFSGTFEELQNYKVEFVSVKEQLDTSSPIGRAMMYICSVFAQMERETIAERIRDSSLELAKSGKWAGGQAPVGYARERRIDQNGKHYTVLIKETSGYTYVKRIFDVFNSGNSLSGLESECRTKGILSPAGRYISSSCLYQIITNPVYTRCTQDVWDYYKSNGCVMESNREEFDGSSGVVAYNRTSGSRSTKHIKHDMSDWIIIKGLHDPLIEPADFLKTQRRLGLNKISKVRQYDAGLLRGLLYCSCGMLMSAKRNIDYASTKKTAYWYYVCGGRSRKASAHNCKVKQINLLKIDDIVISALRAISFDAAEIDKYIESESSDALDNKSTLEKELSSCRNKVSNLVSRLQEAESSSAGKYIISSIEMLDNQIISLQSRIDNVKRSESNKLIEQLTKRKIVEKITDHMHEFDSWSFEEQQEFIKNTISKCLWDGETLRIYFL